MRSFVLVAILIFGALIPVAAATIDACSEAATTPAPPPVVMLLQVSGIMAYMDGSCQDGSGIVGGGQGGWMAECVDPGVHVALTTYCGPMVAGHAKVTCQWVGVSGPIHLLTVGFDLNGDGHIFNSFDGMAIRLGETPPPMTLTLEKVIGKRLWPALGSGSWIVENPHDEAARVIAYPTTTRDHQAQATARIGCV